MSASDGGLALSADPEKTSSDPLARDPKTMHAYPTNPSKRAVALRVGILGSGLIGSDLLVKVMKDPHLECVIFAGRNPKSPGLRRAADLGVTTSADGVDAILNSRPQLVFDATSAAGHLAHAPLFAEHGIFAVDLTPSNSGRMYVPAVDGLTSQATPNISLITCGGQASVPIAHAIAEAHNDIEYIEVVSAIASRSAGPATRNNLDEYVATTEAALHAYTGIEGKAILIINPAEPCIDMQTTVYARATRPRIRQVRASIDAMVNRIRLYVPGYQIIVPPRCDADRIQVSIRVKGSGDFLPPYAGNLDLINCSALTAAQRLVLE
jgi:acetaldehyde dehydrogenase (acetylating)